MRCGNWECPALPACPQHHLLRHQPPPHPPTPSTPHPTPTRQVLQPFMGALRYLHALNILLRDITQLALTPFTPPCPPFPIPTPRCCSHS